MKREGENQEIKFVPQELAISTAIHYPKWYAGEINWNDGDQERLTDKVRGNLALEMILGAKNKGYQVVVVDSEASPFFTQRLEELEIKRFWGKDPGISASRQLGFKEASAIKNVKYLCWTEPEKIPLLDYLPDLVRPISEGTAEIVMPKRKEKEFRNSYPDYQFNYEKQNIYLWNNMLRKFRILSENSENLDIFFGPEIFKNTPELREIFLAEYVYKENSERSFIFNKLYRPDRYSNSTIFPIIMALHKKLRVVSIEIPYIHPKNQTKLEINNDFFIKKRLSQGPEIIKTSADFCRMLVGTKSNTFLQSRPSI